MGWGRERRPVLYDLNRLTNSANIDKTYKFFTDRYENNGQRYRVGDLCADIPASRAPWGTKKPIKDDDKKRWRHHCQKELNVPNPGGKNTVEQDLTAWIRDAILNKVQVVYLYKETTKFDQAGKQRSWSAKRTVINDKKIKIVVTGPGF